jgi:hypothetical protein
MSIDDASAGNQSGFKEREKSLGELFDEFSAEFADLMRTHVELAKAELLAEARKAGVAGGMFGGAAVAGHLALLLLSVAAAWGLENIMNAGWAFLIVGSVYAIAAAVLAFRGRDQAKHIRLVPPQALASMKEDMRWARQMLS